MYQELRPVNETLIDLLKCFGVILRQFNALPQLRGHVRSLDGFHIEVQRARFGVGADSGIAGVSKRAGLTIAEACNVVFIAAEVLLFGGSG